MQLEKVSPASDAHDWLSPTQFIEPGSYQSLGCTPLGAPAAMVRDSVEDRVEPRPALIFQQGPIGSVAGAIATEDGTYEVLLGPGRWSIALTSSSGGTTPCTPGSVTVDPGQDQVLDIVCPYTEEVAAEILERLLADEEDD